MKTNPSWIRTILFFCLLALVSSCNDLKQEAQVTPDQNRAEYEAIAKQYGLKLTTIDPSAKNVIHTTSVQAFRDTLAKYYSSETPAARQARREAFAKSLLAEHLGPNHSPEQRAQFDKWNARRVAKLLVEGTTVSGNVLYIGGCEPPRRWGGTGCFTPGDESRGGELDENDESVPRDGGSPGPGVPTDGPVYIPPGSTPSPGGPGDYSDGGPGGPGGTTPAGPPAKYSFGKTPSGPGQMTKGNTQPLHASVGYFNTSSDLLIFYDFHRRGSRGPGIYTSATDIDGANVDILPTGGNNIQLYPSYVASTAYEMTDGLGGYHISAVMGFEYTIAGGSIGTPIVTVGVEPTAATFVVRISFTINKDGSASALFVERL